jgi:hypothetical protein
MTEEVTFLDSLARIHVSSARTDGFALIEVFGSSGTQPPGMLPADLRDAA